MEMDRENLITAYLEGTASPEQVREVDRLVQSDPTFRRDLLVEGVVDSRLAAGVTWSADIFRFRQLVLRNRFFRSALCAAAAVLVLGFGLVWYIGNTKPITVVIMRSPGRVERCGNSDGGRAAGMDRRQPGSIRRRCRDPCLRFWGACRDSRGASRPIPEKQIVRRKRICRRF